MSWQIVKDVRAVEMSPELVSENVLFDVASVIEVVNLIIYNYE